MKTPIVRTKFIVSVLIIATLIGGTLLLPKIKVPARNSDEIPENMFIQPEVKAPEQAISSTVSIFFLGNGIGRCSGVVVKETEDNTHILTAKHCINVSEENYVDNNLVTFIVTSPNDDLAYLIVDGQLENRTVATIGNQEAKIDETIYHIGYPDWDGKMYKANGPVNRKTNDWSWANLRSKGGCSGGGIFNEEGELVGILWGGLTFEPVTIFEPLRDIKIFLDKINQTLK